MSREVAQFTIKGMTRDLADSKFNPEYAFENHNIRITPSENSTLLVLSNEKGNIEVSPELVDTFSYNNVEYNSIENREVLGYAILNKTIVLFQKANNLDIISVVYKNNNVWKEKVLYCGDLKFNINYPIETLPLYESRDIQKVYWVDGLNQPRVINITDDEDHEIRDNYDTQFDFVPTLELGESITITRVTFPTGHFPAGTLQYAFTYSRRNGQESKLFWISNLHYTTFDDRAGAPDEITTGSYKITINPTTVDTGFDYINIYSIIRSSEDAGLQTRLVTQLDVVEDRETYEFIDTNTLGETIATTDLLYKGGDELVAETMAVKDNTLFVGNIETKGNKVSDEIKEGAAESTITYGVTELEDWVESNGFYYYKNPLLNNTVTYLKSGNKYRIGIQLQDEKGQWSEPIFIKDEPVKERPKINGTSLDLPLPQINLTTEFINKCTDEGYKRVRPIIVYPEPYERGVIAQGITSPTVFLNEDRRRNSPFAQSSWFFRPYNEHGYDTGGNGQSGTADSKWSVEARHAHCLAPAQCYNAEIQNAIFGGYATGSPTGRGNQTYYVDGSILTFHSPEVNDSLTDRDLDNTKIHIVGAFAIDAVNGRIRLVANPPSDTRADFGEVTTVDVDKSIGEVAQRKLFTTQTVWKQNYNEYYLTYPFHKKGLWQNLSEADGDKYKTGDITLKVTSNIRYSQEFAFYDIEDDTVIDITESKIFRKENGDNAYALTPPSNFALSYNTLYYRGNMNKPIIYNTEYPIYYSTSFNGTATTNSSDSKYQTQDPIYVNYRSEDHIVVSLDNHGQGKGTTLPTPVFESDPNGDLTCSKFGIDNVFWLNNEVESSEESNTNNSSTSSSDTVTYDVQYLQSDDIMVRDNLCNDPSSISRYPDADNNPDRFVVRVIGTSYDSYVTLTYPFTITVWKYRHNLEEGEEDIPENHWISATFPTDKNVLNITAIRERNMIGLGEEGSFMPDNELKLVLNSDDGHVWRIPGPESGGGGGDDPGELGYRIDLPDGFVPNNREVMWITEYVRDIPENIFGGTEEYAIKSNKWLPCGESVILDTSNPIINITEGDTIFNRWDCVKTLPYSTEDVNQIVEIMSFMCESYINTAGRYDKFRGKQDYTFLDSSVEFNQMNPAYNNRNNYFTYRITDLEKNRDTDYPNVVVWSMTKTLGEQIDSWTHLLLSSSMSLDGDKGEIRALRRWKNEIFSFQDTGIAQIIYNPSAAIATTAGVPIEIANSGKVEGKRYISESVGCTNKWSIQITQSGVYFIDPINKRIYLWTDNGMTNLSESKGFTSYFNNAIKEVITSRWSPKNWDTSDFITLYDKNVGDVYFINPTTCLAFNESLGEFTSFYDYINTPFMINLDNDCLAYHNKVLWNQHKGQYNKFFDNQFYSPYSVEVVVNPKPTADKVFDNIEFRADSWDNKETLLDTTFDYLEGWNEYQYGGHELKWLKGYPSSLKKKFRIWYANIPRDENVKRDRLRNTWLHLKLSKNNPETERTVLHDLIVKYTI